MAVANRTNSAAPSARSNADQSPSQARDIFRIVQKRWLLVVLVTATVTIAGGILAYTRPREYSASALVLIHEVPPGFFWLEQDANTPPLPQTSVETQARLVETLRNAEKTSRELAEGEGAPGIAVDAAEILDATTVEIEEPDILRIRVSSRRRNAVVPIANTLAEVPVPVKERWSVEE